jgi:UPF0716 protein FxsA
MLRRIGRHAVLIGAEPHSSVRPERIGWTRAHQNCQTDPTTGTDVSATPPVPDTRIILTFVLFLYALLFIGAEVVSFVIVADHIGFFWALAILLIVSASGPFVVRRVGIGVVSRTQERLGRGEVPTRELLDGLVVLLGGVMICVPGFIGDALGLLLMIGPIRRLVIRGTGHRLARRVQRIPVRNWRVIAMRPQSMSEDSPPPSRPRDRSLGPGEEHDN